MFVTFDDVCKTYDGLTNVVDHLDLVVAEGEFLSLLGPSGSGKTTTLLRTGATSAWCSRTTRCFRT
jgi:putative spermidine/putrescine transport system ATP-binding protein